MYRLGRRQVHHYLLYGGALAAIIAVVTGTIILSRAVFQANTVITQSPAVTHTVKAYDGVPQTVRKSVFTMELPADWEPATPPNFRYPVYSWSGTGRLGAARRLDVYIDGLPADLAVNRLLPVQATGDGLQVTGVTSDNCVNFTDKTAVSARLGQAPSKWGGVNFICDMGNYERDVVAIGAPGSVNQIALDGTTKGQHNVLLIYTDNNINPDYSIFVAIANSFRIL